MKNTTLKTRRLVAVVTVCFACFSLGLTAAQAGSDDNDKRSDDGNLLISFEENFANLAPDGTSGDLDGKATLAGVDNDKGARHEHFTVTSVSKDGTRVGITGTSRIIGAKGTLFAQFTGTIYFSADPNIAYVEGVESITGGTGDLRERAGKGTFEATQDFAGQPYQVVGVVELNVKKDR